MTGMIFQGLLIPFLGTVLGAAMVFLLKGRMSRTLQRILTGSAAGVMTAASFWSLLQPALEGSAHMGRLAFIPVASGFLTGSLFLLLLDNITPHMHLDTRSEGPRMRLKRTTKLFLAVTLHNVPEGLAVGVVFAGWLTGQNGVTLSGAMILSLGIALQNFPEGAIVSMPLRSAGMSRMRTFMYGVLSGAVEPLAAGLALAATGAAAAALPFMLAFAAGAMMYVVVEELIPEMSEGGHSNAGTISFALGFVLMMILDTALG